MSTATFQFYCKDKQQWIDSYSVASRAEANRLNAIVGWGMYREKEDA